MEEIVDKVIFGFSALLLGGGLVLLAYYYNFFKLKEREDLVPPSIFVTLTAFLIYFGVQILVILIAQGVKGPELELESLMKVGLAGLSIAVFVLIGFAKWKGLFSKRLSFSVFLTALFTWLIAFPLVVGIYNLLFVLLGVILGPDYPLQEQDVVKTIQQIENNPALFWSFFVVVGLLVPMGEEILFRGFLQRWLCFRLGNRWGIIAASLCFAALHYSSTQGYANLVILPSLFILSLFIGFIYLKERSLWAPIVVHALHNSFGVFIV